MSNVTSTFVKRYDNYILVLSCYDDGSSCLSLYQNELDLSCLLSETLINPQGQITHSVVPHDENYSLSSSPSQEVIRGSIFNGEVSS
jgi:hypothetical protein